MHVGVDDVADGRGRAGADRGAQPLPFADTAAGIDHRDCLVADHESNIGDRPFIVPRHQCEGAGMHEYPRRYFGDDQWLDRLLRMGSKKQGAERQR